jgi:DNA transformation protein and related proteins
MRVTDSFRDFVIDQLGNVPDLRARAMFGGIGLYASDTFFGILAADVLYFKVDETTRPTTTARAPRRSSPTRATSSHTTAGKW